MDFPFPFGASGFAIPDNFASYSNIMLDGIPILSIPGSVSGNMLVSIKINIAHTYTGDLIVSLCDPSGDCADLGNRVGGGCSTTYESKTFDDASAWKLGVSSYACGSALPAYLAPQDSLGFQGRFSGHNPNGQWVLHYSDNAGGDTGTIYTIEFDFKSKPLSPSWKQISSFASLKISTLAPFF